MDNALVRAESKGGDRARGWGGVEASEWESDPLPSPQEPRAPPQPAAPPSITATAPSTPGRPLPRGGIFSPSAPTRSAPGLPAPLQVARLGAHLTRRLHPRRSNSIQVPAAVRSARAHPEPLRLQPRLPLPTILSSEAPGGFPVGKTTLAQSRRPSSLVPPPPCVPTTPEPLDCQPPQVSSGGEERARTSARNPAEPPPACARRRGVSGRLGCRPKGWGLRCRRPLPRASPLRRSRRGGRPGPSGPAPG